MSRHIVPIALLVRVQCFRKDLYKAVEGQAQDRSSSRWSCMGSYFRCRMRLTIFEPDETKTLRVWPSLVCRLLHLRRMGERFLQKHIIKVSGATARWPFTDSAVPSLLLLLRSAGLQPADLLLILLFLPHYYCYYYYYYYYSNINFQSIGAIIIIIKHLVCEIYSYPIYQ